MNTYVGEQNEVLEASVEMRLLFQADDALKMRVVDVCINAEETLEDGSHHLLKVRGKWNTCIAKSKDSIYTQIKVANTTTFLNNYDNRLHNGGM